jgi:hypothetical protein
MEPPRCPLITLTQASIVLSSFWSCVLKYFCLKRFPVWGLVSLEEWLLILSVEITLKSFLTELQTRWQVPNDRIGILNRCGGVRDREPALADLPGCVGSLGASVWQELPGAAEWLSAHPPAGTVSQNSFCKMGTFHLRHLGGFSNIYWELRCVYTQFQVCPMTF